MSTCKYCGQKAGLFSDYHSECKEKHEQGVERLKKLMEGYFNNPNNVATLLQDYPQVVKEYYLSKEDIAICADSAINKYSEVLHRPFSSSILQIVTQFLIQFKVSYSEADR